MAKFGYYKKNSLSMPVLIQEFEASGTRSGGKPEVVSLYQDGPDQTRHDVATIHLDKGEWVARTDVVSAHR
jgi:hypothetical protein